MRIIIETIPHDQQRYPTAGDWYFETVHELATAGSGKMSMPVEVLHIKVSELADWRYNALVAIHELVEVLKCKHDGVTQEQVDAFDIAYEKNRPEAVDSEPGDSPDAPYRQQHCLAMGIERIMAAALGVEWEAYDKALLSLP